MAYVTKRGSSYQIRVYQGYDAKGKQHVKTVTWKPTDDMSSTQIIQELSKRIALAERQYGSDVVSSPLRFEELVEEWFANYGNKFLKHTTLDTFEGFKPRVYSQIGHFYVNKITTRTIQSFINRLSEDTCEQHPDRKLSPKTIKNYLSFISGVFDYGLRMGYVDTNPCKNVFSPKVRQKEKKIYSREEMNQLLHEMEQSPLRYKAFFFLLSYSGFRRSEMLGLEWEDVDFENRTISVQRATNYTSLHGQYTDTTKTEKSQRTIQVSHSIINLLSELKKEQEELEKELGKKWKHTNHIFTGPLGGQMGQAAPYNFLRKFCEKNGLPFYGIHTFRHFVASVLVEAGTDVAAVSRTLGHSNTATTLNIYTHSFNNMRSKVSSTLDQIFGYPQ